MIQVAIVGCGRVAKTHAANLSKLGRLVAVCDIESEKAKSFAEDFNARPYSSIDELLNTERDVALVVICSPNGLHAEHIIKSLQAGKNVFTENPLCLTKAAAWQIVETEKFCRQRIFLAQPLRYNPVLQQLKALLTKGALGTVYSFSLNWAWQQPNDSFTDWRGKLFPGGGLLYNQCSHYLDFLLQLFGEVKEARGFVGNFAAKPGLEYEDTGAVALQTQNGVLGTFQWTINASQKGQQVELTIVAEKSTVKIGGEYLDELQDIQSEQPLRLEGFKKEETDFYALMYEELVYAIGNNEKNFPTVFDGLRTVEAIEKIYNAVR